MSQAAVVIVVVARRHAVWPLQTRAARDQVVAIGEGLGSLRNGLEPAGFVVAVVHRCAVRRGHPRELAGYVVSVLDGARAGRLAQHPIGIVVGPTDSTAL